MGGDGAIKAIDFDHFGLNMGVVFTRERNH